MKNLQVNNISIIFVVHLFVIFTIAESDEVVPDIEQIIPNPVEGEEIILSESESTKETRESYPVQTNKDVISDTEPVSEISHSVFSAPVNLQDSSNVCHNEESDNANSLEHYKEQAKKYEQLFRRSERRRIIMKKNHKKTQMLFKRKLTALKKEVSINNQYSKIFQNLLNSDQIKLLNCEYKKIPKWCDKTLVKAFQLKFACGNSGYKELLRQNFPLPSNINK